MNTILLEAVQETALSFDTLRVLLAVIPVLLLVVLLGVMKVSGDKSALVTLGATILISVFGFSFPAKAMGLSVVYGVLKAIFPILIIIVMAIFSYQVLVHTKKMEVIKSQFTSISSDKCIQVLLLTWGFGGLLEGMAGFGTAVAIPAAILISLGFQPIFSAVVSLIANSVATGFGAVGTPVIVLAQQAGLTDVPHLSSQIIIQLSPLMFIIPFILLYMTDSRAKMIPRHILLSVIVGGVSLIVQYFAAKFMGAETPAILGSIASIIVIIAYAKLMPNNEAEGSKEKEHFSMSEVLKAWSVYGLILLLVVLTSPILPFKEPLKELFSTNLSFDIFDAAVGGVQAKRLSIFWLVDTGILLFVGSMLGGLIQGASLGGLFKLLGTVIKNQYKTIITVSSLIALSSIMDYSGMITELGVALAVLTGSLYPLFAPTVGCIGTFLTGSDTSSNILFGKLQAEVASVTGADPSWLAAANTAGATGGKIISPQSIAIATSSCGQQGQEGAIMKKAMPFALIYIVVSGLMVYFVPKLMGLLIY